MFSKKTSRADEIPAPAVAPELQHGGKKAGPTPKRKEREAANRVPLVPGDRRAAAKVARAKIREERETQYRALQTGDERHLPPRDKGPVRRYVRDFVDARRNLGEIFLFVAVIFMVLVLFVPTQAAVVVTSLLYVIVLGTILDGFLMWRSLKKRLHAKFGAEKIDKSLRWYAVMRAFQIRRARLPKPQVKHGEYPV
ncbi:hypothetical protein GCM10011331_14900 [Flavimobilis marinus]|uniref:DUF3043 domain-containing protein n=1 Tax=Flavimobilis marinus TaxID=285351 RepID=A0A1I2FSZ8_9MICO|nr:DUF3043 domain-containing protein [Flavimobilis marinus]GHG51362.1 hypothetical protein GCM10011331_14900 [Flavimobilis marinus]SFF07867.1 Protein of unknown function [Flavimobilis marinus]